MASNARYWDGAAVPVEGFTAGMDILLGAEVVVLLVAGAHKQEILRRSLAEPETPDVPASYLRRVRSLVVVADAAAAAGLASVEASSESAAR